MTVLMDDPTTYLSRDNDVPCVILAASVDSAMTIARGYGVAIQVNGPDPTKGVRVVSTEADARGIITQLPATTPWAAIADAGWPFIAYNVLYAYFGKPLRMDQALNVINTGKAWRPNQTVVL